MSCAGDGPFSGERLPGFAQRRHAWNTALLYADEAIRLRADVSTTLLGAPLKPAPRDFLKRAYATYIMKGNPQDLRDGLREGLALVPDAHALSLLLHEGEPHSGEGSGGDGDGGCTGVC